MLNIIAWLCAAVVSGFIGAGALFVLLLSIDHSIDHGGER